MDQADLQYLADRLALQDVMLRYAKGVDERDMTLYRSCFADDAEFRGFGPDPIVGGDAWAAFVTKALAAYGPTQHLMTPQLATVSGNRAQCRTDVQALHHMIEPEGEIFTLWATYETEMTRTEQGWKIQRHGLVPRGSKREML